MSMTMKHANIVGLLALAGSLFWLGASGSVFAQKEALTKDGLFITVRNPIQGPSVKEINDKI